MLLCLAYLSDLSMSVRGCRVFREHLWVEVGKSLDFGKSSCRN
jgi:hypothetical protein